MDLLLPAGIAVASIGLTYAFCIRPMRQGHCAMMLPQMEKDPSADHREEIARLRAEIESLKQAGSDGVTIRDRKGT